jgi:triphosphoribosyl-dephospho-CoA synthase
VSFSPDFVASAAQLACLLEASAPKPGNVSPARHFHDTRYEHFLASAVVIGPALALAGERPIGPSVLAAVEATARWAPANTNLGIILLFAPLARAALTSITPSPTQVGAGQARGDTYSAAPARSARATGTRRRAPRRHAGPAAPDFAGRSAALRDGVTEVLAATTVADARDVYAAIRLARPGGLGRAPSQDVSNQPTATLHEVMALAAPRDAVAREYASDFATTFEVGVPALERARADGLSWDEAAVETYVTLLARVPDSLIARKMGPAAAAAFSEAATAAVAAGGVRTAEGRSQLDALDRDLRDDRNAANPGATADLTAAALFVHLLTGGWG